LKESLEAIVAEATKAVDKSVDTGSTAEYNWQDTDGRP
jgi:hypothetical protein